MTPAITLDTQSLAQVDQLLGRAAALDALRTDARSDLVFHAAAIAYQLAAEYPCPTPVPPLPTDLDLAQTVDAALRLLQELDLDVITAIPDLGQLNAQVNELRLALHGASDVGAS